MFSPQFARSIVVAGITLLGLFPAALCAQGGGGPAGPVDARAHLCYGDEICDPESQPEPPAAESAALSGFSLLEAMPDTDVQSVAIDVTLNYSSSTISGTVTMLVQAVQSVSQFTIRAHSNFTVSATVNGNAVTVGAPVNSRTRTITLDRTYSAGEQFTLLMTYSGATAGAGFGSFTWTTHSGTQIASSLSEPYYAYTWWPCKDGDANTAGDNSDKFTLDMKVTLPNTMQVASNGALDSTTNLPGSLTRYRWVSNYPISTYLVSLSGTVYHTFSDTYIYPNGSTNASMPLQFFIYAESDTTANQNVWKNVKNMMAAYRGVYGEYPFIAEKYGIYQFPFSGGMEHQTMTGQGGGGAFNEGVTAHELSHQWWGDMITCKTWGDIWLNEGFATFSEAIWSERKPGGSSAAYHSTMAGHRPSTTAGTVYCYNTSSVNSIFSTDNSYYKGAWVAHMLRHVMGDTTFFQTLANYRAAYAYSAATTDNFAGVCSAAYGSDLSWYFNEWVYNAGAPTYQWGSQALQVNGLNYLLLYIHQTQLPTYGVFTMPIDIKYTAGGNPITRSVWNNAATEYYVLKVPEGAPSSVQFDPTPWILRGTTSTVSYLAGPPVIVAATPGPGGQLAANTHPRTLSLGFHTNVTTQASDYSLSGPQGAVPLSFAYSTPTLTTTLTTASPMLPGHYTLTAAQTVTAVNSGMALDGEIANAAQASSLPSGDGQPGGAAVWTFDVVGSAADIDNSGVFDATDVTIFVNVLLGLDTDPAHLARSDFTGDSRADGNDVAPFVASSL